LEFGLEGSRGSGTDGAGRAGEIRRAGREGWGRRSWSARGSAGWRGDKNLARVGTGGGDSTQGSGVKARGSRAGLDEVAEDSDDLLAVRDDGENSHAGTAAATA